ncbi:MAG TPA: hypothetical protein VEE82_02640, partial [Thermodesulfovibrionales bacterium]|nr:hypothetical protein [Thermodesulfovibrionales bacterium]
MKLKGYKTRLLAVVFGCLLSMMLVSSLWSQSDYPTKPINLLISFAPGGVMDISTRAIAAKA